MGRRLNESSRPLHHPASLASGPDGADEHTFSLLENNAPELAATLKRRYAERWLSQADLPEHRLEEAIASVELKVAADEPGFQRLRLTSYYTGSTYWRPHWDGSLQGAVEFIDEAAQLQADNVRDDRRHGPTPWDESPTRRKKRARRRTQ